MVNKFKSITANAIVPDQLLPYVKAVSRLDTHVIGTALLHYTEDQGVLVIFPPHDSDTQESLDVITDEAMKFSSLKHLTVISTRRPSLAPIDAVSQKDYYWRLPIPCTTATNKTANMLRRAEQQIIIQTTPDCWDKEHTNLVHSFCASKEQSLDPGSVYLFKQLETYIKETQDTVLFSAYTKDTSKLVGLTIGDYSAFNTAFYMFAFRSPNAPPGTSDLLLAKLLEEAEKRGHAQVNLGLGINKGIEFFKKKWGAEKFLPYVETSWKIERQKPKNWFFRMFKS